jgi:hypothetical protein
MISTLDLISNGRVELGIGAGWYEQEFRAYGYHFPNNDAKASPNTDDNDNTNTDLTIPILFILIRKKYSDVPKPTTRCFKGSIFPY